MKSVLLMRKGFGHKYLRKDPAPGGGWRYVYGEAAGDKPAASPEAPESGTMRGMGNGKGSGNGSRPASLKDHIHKILHGTDEEKKKFKNSFFHMAYTPDFMKDLGLIGDYFSVRYGVVSRHEGKDADHNLTERNWIDLTEAITRPFAIAKHGSGYRLFTDVKINGKFIAVGVDVKAIGKDIEVNAISTAFGKEPPAKGIKNVIYRDKKITPEQAALLKGPDSPSYSPGGAISTVSPQSGKKSSPRSMPSKK